MVEYDRRDLVCLYLDACTQISEGSTVAPAVTAAGIGDALELGDTAASRVRLLDDLATLGDEGLVSATERHVEGYDAPRTVYAITERGSAYADRIRERISDQSVVVAAGGATETVSLADVDRYFEDDRTPLVTALARLTDDGRIQLDRHKGERFVNRDGPLSTVKAAIEASFTRDSQTVVVAGTAGMGKTALVQEVVERVRDDHEDVVFASGSAPSGAAAPYAPFRQVFDAIPDGDDLLERLDDAGRNASPADPETLAARRTALFDAVADGLREAAVDRPIVVFLDNLHWADDATLDLFAHLATTIDELVYPVAFACAYRTPAVAGGEHPLPAVLDRIAAAGTREDVTLDPLGHADARAILADVLGQGGLPEGFVDLVYDRTGGNPLFVRETATHLLETGQVDPETDAYPTEAADVSVPQAVADQIERRLRELDDASRELLRLGAVIGERIPGGVLAAASDLEPATRREYVDVLLASHVWEPVEGDPGALADASVTDAAVSADGSGDLQFVSGALREAVVDRLPAERERDLHARVARAFVETTAEDAQAARIAHHHETAGDDAAAVDAYRRAGDHASDTYAHEDAIEHYERALALGRDGDVDAATIAGVHADVASVYRRIGKYERGSDVADEGLAVAPDESRECGRLLGVQAGIQVDQGNYDDAEDRAERQYAVASSVGAKDLEAAALRRLGVITRYQAAFDRAQEYFQESLEIAEGLEDRRAEALGLKDLGTVLHRLGDHHNAREYFQRSLDVARGLEDRRLTADNLGNLALVAKADGEYDRAREHLERCLEIFRDLGHRKTEAKCLNNAGIVAIQQTKFDNAQQRLERGLAIASDLDARHLKAKCLNNLGLLAERRGEFDDARAYQKRSLAIERELGDRRGQALSLENLGEVAREGSEYEQAHEHLQESLALRQELDSMLGQIDSRNYLGALTRDRGEFEQAREHFERSLEISREIDDVAGRARALAHLGEVARQRGAFDRAEGYFVRSLDVARDLDGFTKMGIALHGLGNLARQRGNFDVAQASLEGALEEFEESGERFHLGEMHLSVARLALARGDRDAARAWAEEARETFAERDSTHWIGRTEHVFGNVAADAGRDERARDRWQAALERFEAVGAPHDALATIERLVDAAVERGDDDRARELRDRAQALLEEAPEAVADRNREWL